MARVVARLPEGKRAQFKTPLGPVFESVEGLLESAGEPIVSVGDVVLAHLGRAGCSPALSIVDGRTERGAVDQWILDDRPSAAVERTVENPPGTITAELVAAIEDGLDRSGPARIEVAGEEDLAVLPAVLLAPRGGTVVYGQPGEGMVATAVDDRSQAVCRDRLAVMERDADFWAAIG
ncbi:MAG: GTP-dependent dephospho-CoA kinase family protein [Halodesulfurarchaeum sp.]